MRFRAKTTHGYGSMKKHRGAGHRGGKGNAGSGKRGDAKKPSFWKEPYLGKIGIFKGRTRSNTDVKTINLSTIEIKLDSYVASKLVEEKNGVYEVDIKKLGFDKVLGSGKLVRKIKLIAPTCSKSVAKKVKAAGGELVVDNPPAESDDDFDDADFEDSKEEEKPKAKAKSEAKAEVAEAAQ